MPKALEVVAETIIDLPDQYKFQLLALLIFTLAGLWVIRYLGRLGVARAKNAINGRVVTHKHVSDAIQGHRETCSIDAKIDGLDGKFDVFNDGLTGETGTLTIMLHKLECLEGKVAPRRRAKKRTTRRKS
jgi:hypothetical protein